MAEAGRGRAEQASQLVAIDAAPWELQLHALQMLHALVLLSAPRSVNSQFRPPTPGPITTWSDSSRGSGGRILSTHAWYAVKGPRPVRTIA